MNTELLNEELEELFKLHDLRKKVKKLREEGVKSLSKVNFDTIQKARDEEIDWTSSGDNVEVALILKVQSHKDIGNPKITPLETSLVEELSKITLEELFQSELNKTQSSKIKSSKTVNVPVLIAARTMQALTLRSATALSETSMICYYRIVREIYSADSPDWIVGGAKAGAGGKASAFVTSECIRAISSIGRVFRQTGNFFRETYLLLKAIKSIDTLPDCLADWKKTEIERVVLNWQISSHSQNDGVLVELPPPAEYRKREEIDTFLADLPAKLLAVLNGTKDRLESSRELIDEFRENEVTEEERQPDFFDQLTRYHRKEGAEMLASDVIENIQIAIEGAIKLIENDKGSYAKGNPKLFEELSNIFLNLAKATYAILEPSKRYIKTVLDRELAQAGGASLDAGELIFAATSFGAIYDWAPNEVLDRACELAVKSISERGEISTRRPFHSTNNGYRLNTIQFEMFRAISQLIQKVNTPLSSSKAQRMIKFIEDNKILGRLSSSEGVNIGWNFEDVPLPRKPSLWVTALTVLALDRIVRMLNEKINSAILEKRFFEVIKPSNGGLKLNDLIYSDYGLYNSTDINKEFYQRPLAITLQLMSAHIARAQSGKDKLYSCILYGPPGTGKTTLAEALAQSCGVNLVRLSPSDLIVHGQEAIETRAKAIFDALSLLSQTVILLDEFEPVVYKRLSGEKKENIPLVSFLKTGMFPKLKKLHDSCNEQNNVYFLATNFFDDIDAAAKRKGRFDVHIPVFNPDPISRAGTLLFRLIQHIENCSSSKLKKWEEASIYKLASIIKKTSDVSVHQLATDWLKISDKYELSGIGYNYLFSGEDEIEGEKAVDEEQESYDPKGSEGKLYGSLEVWEKSLNTEKLIKSLERLEKSAETKSKKGRDKKAFSEILELFLKPPPTKT